MYELPDESPYYDIASYDPCKEAANETYMSVSFASNASKPLSCLPNRSETLMSAVLPRFFWTNQAYATAALDA